MNSTVTENGVIGAAKLSPEEKSVISRKVRDKYASSQTAQTSQPEPFKTCRHCFRVMDETHEMPCRFLADFQARAREKAEENKRILRIYFVMLVIGAAIVVGGVWLATKDVEAVAPAKIQKRK